VSFNDRAIDELLDNKGSHVLTRHYRSKCMSEAIEHEVEEVRPKGHCRFVEQQCHHVGCRALRPRYLVFQE
jgi:hypothetical protein